MPTSSNTKISAEATERENWFKLVMKVLTWKESATKHGLSNDKQRITHKEWNFYVSQSLKINPTGDKKAAKEKLEEVKKAIESAGGFE